ncbi:hypothetical protein GUITHDRAFT_101025 [Guillardia theta CCMP2712]|uniref:CBM20 domain-containing protein n=1 Tax=Guillardia theta (strain CCMP2712) TaxID=905079 RepID=L1JY98_GUITC|nr:hypothetical protein GUITHDRAFT_101025 [Guillardia theta CCMP2712]EKX53322.1 hypothetical protein GUITHDRAFT_101025 [Guillardia theta CCMP2712]|mmetsp:Transcript_23131/g.75256  ORF Transcript_23131/g.75256 Transcript_23131/m.75256 type:complete len:1149 (-) Transcript_23131:972-4418(-)|eukprot:XP_005840302.1 hypothetical protein GUITHDRAFT_101025 [Guillardia theta CCMP2712]
MPFSLNKDKPPRDTRNDNLDIPDRPLSPGLGGRPKSPDVFRRGYAGGLSGGAKINSPVVVPPLQQNGDANSSTPKKVASRESGMSISRSGSRENMANMPRNLSSSSSSSSASGMAGSISRNRSQDSMRGSSKDLASQVRQLSRKGSREDMGSSPGSSCNDLVNKQVFSHGVSDQSAMTRVDLHVEVTSTSPGDRVVVTGSIQELGYWDPRGGVELQTNQVEFPQWSATFAAPSGQSVEYKYVIMKANGEMDWETKIENRMFTTEGNVLTLEDGKFDVESAKLLNKDFVSVDRSKPLKKNILDLPVELETTDTIYVVTYRLPLTAKRDPDTGALSFQWLSFASDSTQREADNSKVMRSESRHAGYVVENLRALRARCRVLYVGGLGIDIPPAEQEAVTEELMSKFQCIPVFLPPDMRAEYEDFCHNILKPIFHFVHPTSADVCRAFASEAKWQLYSAVNREYVKPVVQNFNDGDLVLVFDLGLMMAPTLIGSRARTANICFFFNTPFPSSEIFRTMPVRKEALRSLLNADLIQFHCFTYARHFLSCCSTLLGIEHRPARCGLVNLVFNGHHVNVRASHVGIDAETLNRRLQEERVLTESDFWAEKFRRMKKQVILVGYDDMEPLSGITLKLRAYRSMLNLFPEYRASAVLVQVAIPLHDSRGEMMHQEYAQAVTKLAEEINEAYPNAVLMLHEKMPFAPRVALFTIADVLVNSAVRHGLSLVPLEFVLAGGTVDAEASSRGKQPKMGSLVLSEFTACSRVIPGAMRTNPWREEDFARSIVKCLRQPQYERKHWHSQQFEWCQHNTVLRWAENILKDMKMARANLIEMGEDVARTACCRVGLVKSSYKEISSNILKLADVNTAYASGKTRLLIFDVDVLRPPKGSEEEAESKSWPQFVKNLDQLVLETGNVVFLLSSDSVEHLLLLLKRCKGIEKLGLAAEDGYYYKWPGSPADRWDQRQHVKAQWKDVCSLLMNSYKERTTGSYVDEDQVASITWHYGVSNPEFGQIQAKELLNHLNDTLEHLPVEVVLGKSFVRVRHQGITKGALVSHIIQHFSSRGGVDFLLCFGDDRMDEDMFNILRDYQNGAQYRLFQGTEQEVKVFTCTVGRQPTLAGYCLYTFEDVLELSSGLSLQTKRKLRSAATMLELSAL